MITNALQGNQKNESQLVEIIEKQGYEVSDLIGNKLLDENNLYIKIGLNHQLPVKKFKIFTVIPKPLEVALLDLTNKPLQLEIYNQDQKESIIELAKKIYDQYKIPIEVFSDGPKPRKIYEIKN